MLNVPIGHHKLRVTLSGFQARRADDRRDEDGQVKLDLALYDVSRRSPRLRVTRSRSTTRPRSVTIITAQELRAMNYPTIAEAVRGVRGMYLSNDTSYDTIGVRGFSRPGDYGNRILILIDGHPANDDYIWSSYVGFDGRVDIDDIERIEIIRGPGSVLYGTSAFFGVINLVTRSREAPTHGEVAAGAMQNAVGRGRVTGYWRVEQGRRRVDERGRGARRGARLFFSGARQRIERAEQHGLQLVSAGRGAVFGERLHGERSPVRRHRARCRRVQRVHRERARVVEVVHGAVVFHARARRLSRPANTRSTFNDPNTNFTDTRGFVEARFEPQLSKDTQLFVRAHVDMYDFDDNLVDPSPQQNPLAQGVENDIFRGRWGGVEARVQYSSDKLRLMAGGTGIYHFQTLQIGNTATQPVVFDNNGNPGRNDPFAVAAAFVNADIVPVKEIKISAGARFDYYSSIANPQFLDAFNPRLALILKPSKSDTIKVLAGKAFRAPSVYELYYQSSSQFRAGTQCLATDTDGCDLKPEQVYSAEVEYSHRFSPTVSGLVTAYANYVTNLIELDNIADKNGTYANEYRNSINPVFVLGAEAEVRREWRQGWMLSGSVSVSRAGYVATIDDAGGQSHTCIGNFYVDHVCGGLGEVPNSPLVLASLKGAVPIIGRQLMLMSRLSFEGQRFDNAIAAQTGVPQGTTDPGLIWDIVFSGEVERLGRSLRGRRVQRDGLAIPSSAERRVRAARDSAKRPHVSRPSRRELLIRGDVGTFTVSALDAMRQVMHSHYADNLRTHVPDLGNDTNMSCPTPCEPGDPTTCGVSFRLCGG